VSEQWEKGDTLILINKLSVLMNYGVFYTLTKDSNFEINLKVLHPIKRKNECGNFTIKNRVCDKKHFININKSPIIELLQNY
jgi:ribosomal protein L32